MTANEPKPELLTIGDTTKKTINKTLVIGAAFTAAVILAPAAFARDPHEPAPRPSNGIRLAADIVNLVRAIVEPRPAPVIVAPVEPAVTTQVVTVPTVTTTGTGTVIVTGAETAAIPEYSYVLYEDEYIPYYEGWLYYHDDWRWIGTKPRPAAPPRWKPQAHHHVPEYHKVIVLPGHPHGPAPAVRHDPPPRELAPAFRHEAPRRGEPVRTVVVRPETKDAPRGAAPKAARPETKNAPRGDAPKNDGPKKVR